MDRIQIAAIAGAVALIVVWFLTLPDPTRQMTHDAQPGAELGQAPGRTASESTGRVDEDAGSASAGAAAPSEPERADLGAGAEAPEGQAVSGFEPEVRQLENASVRLRVSNEAGALIGVELKDFADRVGPAAGRVQLSTVAEGGALRGVVRGEALPAAEVHEEIVLASSEKVEMRSERGGVSLTRIMSLDPNGYGGRLKLALENRSGRTLRPEFAVVMTGVERATDAPDRFLNYSLVVASVDDGLERNPLAGIGNPGLLDSLFGRSAWAGTSYGPGVEWAGVDSQYFLLAAIPESPREARARQEPLGRGAGRAEVAYAPFEVPDGHRVERSFRLYFGPKLSERVTAVDPSLDAAVQVGWSVFRPLVDIFRVMLHWTYVNLTPNYGVAIILLTILLRLVTFPLTQKSMKSMKRFSQLAPQMRELQEKHKDDRERLQQEMMSLYRRTGINPFSALGGGCLPMLIQFPFLIALYFALQGSIDLRHAPFVLWIEDLSAPENFMTLAGMVPIRPLPLLMGASMVLQQRLTPSTGDPQQQQQRQMMMWMSVFFIFLFYQFPSGLVLYWLVSNVLGILQQAIVNRGADAGKPQPAGAGSKAAAASGAKAGAKR